MTWVLLLTNLVLLGMAVFLWLGGGSEWERYRNRRHAAFVFTIVLTLLLPWSAFAVWKAHEASGHLMELLPPYPGSRVQWVPTESEALQMMALIHLGGREARPADSLRRQADELAAAGEPRHWLATTDDSPAEVTAFYRPIMEGEGWEILESGPGYLLGARDGERLMVTAMPRWTDTRISYTWYPRRSP
jgi:hypothetical protein